MQQRSHWLTTSTLVFVLGFGYGSSAEESRTIRPDFQFAGVEYSAEIPVPEAVLGHRIGERHTRPDQILEYVEKLAEASDRIAVGSHGETYEGRRLLHAIVTSPENHLRLESLRQANLALSESPNAVSDDTIEAMPAVLYLGYSIHGDEASGTEAALLTLYHLAAGSGDLVDLILDTCIVIVEPMMNPDGRNRFVSWANANRGRVASSDPADREHNQPWPGGRANHYLFDLNRDYIPAQLWESQGRLALFHHWRPQFQADFHEMGSNSTFFFQPGVPSRNNPNTPERTYALTREIASFHAKMLDSLGALYFSEETFDDFYYGKGASYPDINGAVGILFEQASTKSLSRETANGVLDFTLTIRNQFAASLSSLEAIARLRTKLLRNQRDFYREAETLAQADGISAYLFEKEANGQRAYPLMEILRRHRIRVFELDRGITIEGREFEPGSAFVVPTRQPQSRLLKALVNRVTSFDNPIFYDISTWTLPLALGVEAVVAEQDLSQVLGREITEIEIPGSPSTFTPPGVAYLMAWNTLNAPRALYEMQRRGLATSVMTRSGQLAAGDGETAFLPGTIVIPRSQPTFSNEQVDRIIQEIAAWPGVRFEPVPTGLTASGPDLGSPSGKRLARPSVALITGTGIRSIEVGEVWFELNERQGIPLSLIDLQDLSQLDLTRYNVLILVSGNYRSVGDETVASLKSWVGRGGTLIAVRSAVRWLIEKELLPERLRALPSDLPPARWVDVDEKRRAQEIPGSILEAQLDSTHPLAFGLGATLSVFRDSDLLLEPSDLGGTTVAVYSSEPLLSGYVPDNKLKMLPGGVPILARPSGRGAVILFTDNPNFRAFWFATARVFLNAVFFGQVL